MAYAAPAAADQANWHIMTMSHGGTVSLVKNLTKHECEFMRARSLGLPATEEEERAEKERSRILYEAPCPPDHALLETWREWQMNHPAAQGCRLESGGSFGWGGGTPINNGDIKTAECFK